MAETAVSLIIDKLTPLLAQGVEWLRAGSDLHNQVTEIKNELQSIQSFLRDADEKAEKEVHITGDIETWVKQVREVAYRIEDVIDEYILHFAQKLGHHRSCTLHYLRKMLSSLQSLKSQHELASEIQNIKNSLREAKERSDRYGFLSSTVSESASNSSWHDPRVASHFIPADEVLGIQEAKQQLKNWLLGEPLTRTVVAVVGMGGLGKSTLAKTVYDDQTVKEHFLCSAWITVSQSYKLKELLAKLVQIFCPTKSCFEETKRAIGMSEELQLITNLRNCLQGKRYLVVLDDIWNLDFWDQIEHALPAGDDGARILITTRNNEVAIFCKKSAVLRVHELQPLPPNLALELFCKKAFHSDSDGSCPKMLESLSLDIVRKCGGLPLAIVALGGLFSTKKKTVPEWKRLYDRLQLSELDHNPLLTNMRKILSLSYHDLPYYLKCCFLYFGVFPENYSISVTRLIRGWIAEGFVQTSEERTLEQVAEEYVTELIQRNMILWYPKSDGVDIFCKVHDLMHETIISLMGKLSFCQVLVGEKENSCFNAQTRRLSILCKIGNIVNIEEHSSIRSVFIFDRNELAKSFTYRLFESCKLLKVLDLEDCPSFDYLPKSVGNLLHLKYLSLRNTKIKKLPKTIGNLLNLQTLSLRDTQVQELPREIYKLRKLRHLICGSENKDIDFGLKSTRGTRIGNGIGKWKSLQTLIGVEAAEDWVEELMMLRELRVLVINNVSAGIARTLCKAIKNMNHLETLDVSSRKEDEVLDLDWISDPPPRLLKLSLRGRLKKLPHWINSQLQNVVTIRLYFSRLMDDPLKDLRALPNLVHLILDGAYCGERLHIEKDWFQELEVLTLGSLERLSTLTAREGALPRLQELVIGPSPYMKELPDDIIYIPNLKTLEIRDMPREFILRLLPEQGQDNWKLKRIPVVKISFKVRGQHSQIFRLGDSGLLKHLKVLPVIS